MQTDNPEIYIPSRKFPDGEQVDNSPIAEAKLASTGTSFVLARVPGTKEELALFEVLNPYSKSEPFFDVSWLSSLRMPLFLIGFVCVIFYQVY